jgi:hypothetical protein
MEMATNKPVTMVPISKPPKALGPSIKPTTIGTTTGNRLGIIISLMAAVVNMSTARPYSGLAVPSMMPLISLNWRRTSTTTAPAAPAHGFHGHGTKQVGNQAANEQAHNDQWGLTGQK